MIDNFGIGVIVLSLAIYIAFEILAVSKRKNFVNIRLYGDEPLIGDVVEVVNLEGFWLINGFMLMISFFGGVIFMSIVTLIHNFIKEVILSILGIGILTLLIISVIKLKNKLFNRFMRNKKEYFALKNKEKKELQKNKSKKGVKK